MTLTEAAPAKVNLTLLITGRRDDGYHLLDSLVVFGPAADRLHAAPAEGLTLQVTGPFAAGLCDEPDNLVMRAARALAAWAGRPATAALTLEKHLPVASGIGGGSADAAAALRLLARLWRITPPATVLADIAAGLGADVPVCLDSRPARMRGIGEQIGPAPLLPSCGLLLVNPGVPLATAPVFRARTGGFSSPHDWPQAWTDATAMAHALAAAGNDLQDAACRVCAPVAAVLDHLARLPGVLLSRMSGSGATCFALFATPEAAVAAASGLPPAWWAAGGALHG